MATTTTVGAVKRGLQTELAALGITTGTATAAPLVQVTYGRPAPDLYRRESLFQSDETRTTGTPEMRLTTGRRRRIWEWEWDVIASAEITADTADAEQRALQIAAAVDDWLAAYPQPAEWPNAPVASGALSVIVSAMQIEQGETVEGRQRVEMTMTLEMRERLT